jgi:hypothetical protein
LGGRRTRRPEDVAGGLAVLMSAWVTPQPLRAIFAVMGTISLGFTLASVFLLEWGPAPEGTVFDDRARCRRYAECVRGLPQSGVKVASDASSHP